MIGVTAAEEIIDAIKNFYKSENMLNVLWDLSKSNFDSLRPTDIESIVAIQSKYKDIRKGGKTAIVAPEDLHFGLSRMYQIQADLHKQSFKTRVSRTTEEAQQWLQNNKTNCLKQKPCKFIHLQSI
ncbi:hypothetical protein ACFL20_10255 [Spirochaetota bacterium]